MVDGDYICQEGHISKYVEEMADNVNLMLNASRYLRKKKKEASVFEDYDRSYKKLLMLNLLFTLYVESLGLKTEKYFSYYVNFLSGDREGVSLDLECSLPLLLYLTKREECTSLIFYSSFVSTLSKINLKERIKHFSKLLVYKKFKIRLNRSFLMRNRLVERLSLKNHPTRLSEETGLPHPLEEYNKILFRKDLGLPLEKMLEYFRHLTAFFKVSVSSEMVFYFEKFVYMREYHKGISFPEDEVCYFLFLYNQQDHSLADSIISFLGTTPHIFYKEVQQMLYRSGCNGHSRFFFGTFFYQRHLMEKRFYSFEHYLRRLKKLLKTKKNLKLKKEYVDANMV